ncbi:MAG: hypothetical protein H0U52_03100 [Chloroflexi bacterium]|nr:hypothetical protein [Chloroflexota bacterium]
MNAEFNWWLLIVGLVVGAGLVWLVLADSRRRDVDITERERESEALWIATRMADAGRDIAAGDVLEILRLHADYLAAGPPDEELGDDDPVVDHWTAVADGRTVAGGRPNPDRVPMAHPIARSDDREGSGT